jgi:hypothetical protein
MAENTAKAKALQAVAQSTAIAVQDAADNLRNISTVTATTISVALAQLLATGDPKYVMVIETAQTAMTNTIENYASVGEKSAKILADFEAG